MNQARPAVPDPVEIARRYVVERKLGAGAFGTVYKARDRILGRMVAIKTIRLEGLAAAGTSLDELMTRFMREAQVSAQLKHPNIVTIYDIGESDGLSYLAMEFIDGVGLERVIRDGGPLPFERAASIAAQVADALDYAHRQNVVHRDIKPANVMLEAGDRVKVADFGIARVTDSADHLTATGSLLGTPSYMSPEQARGHELDGRSDLFSVGCVMYELIAGKRAFRGESITGLIFKVITEEPPPLAELRPDCPDELVRIVAKAMAKAPKARFQNGRELADALLKFVSAAATPTLRQVETPTQELRQETLGVATAQTEIAPPTAPTLAPATLPTLAPAAAAPPASPALSPPPPPAGVAAPASAAAPPRPSAPAPSTRPDPRPQAQPGRSRPGSTRLFVGLAVGAGVVVAILGAAAWVLLQRPQAAPQAASAPQAAVAAEAGATPAPLPTPEAVEEVAETAPTARPAASPGRAAAATAARPETAAPRSESGVLVASGEDERAPAAAPTLPRETTGVVRPAAPEPPAPATDFSFLDDEQAAVDGADAGRRVAEQFRGGSSAGGFGAGAARLRARSRVPPSLAPAERPAVATILHLVGAEEAYYREHGRYARLSELIRSRLAQLDVAVQADGFRRRNYRFELVIEDDGFRIAAVPEAGAGRPFVGDDTGFVRVGLQ